MIKFFRHIRQRMIKENRVSRYLLYAIGEIVLVVIGILIALQINNWNDRRIDLKRQSMLLEEMYHELEADRIHFEGKLRTSLMKLNASKALISTIDNNVKYSDTMNIYFSKVVRYTSFIPSTSTFETIRNIGISIIHDKTIRSNIQQLYQKTYLFIKEVDNWRSEFYFSDISSFNIEAFKEFSWYEESIPFDGQQLLNDHRYYNILKTERTLAEQEIDVYKDAIMEIEELRSRIGKEVRS